MEETECPCCKAKYERKDRYVKGWDVNDAYNAPCDTCEGRIKGNDDTMPCYFCVHS